ncbi:hypothetical protein RUM44_011557 [Polyplax serrata]|uniref:Uncharacterized protein n=1 Tax=Polyplax serrata TaxID=468196 RepID=A0ABR1AQD3_POLSC
MRLQTLKPGLSDLSTHSKGESRKTGVQEVGQEEDDHDDDDDDDDDDNYEEEMQKSQEKTRIIQDPPRTCKGNI